MPREKGNKKVKDLMFYIKSSCKRLHSHIAKAVKDYTLHVSIDGVEYDIFDSDLVVKERKLVLLGRPIKPFE